MFKWNSKTRSGRDVELPSLLDVANIKRRCVQAEKTTVTDVEGEAPHDNGSVLLLLELSRLESADAGFKIQD